ncbi:hypothetical protein ACIHFC_28820 [Streptomyces sp. NPDC052013]|uniref:hypothetical protein n=1 Tax=Streptomyces sp. NPDC052013 TaxID=3365679 RepID=UPI0037D02B3B
MAALERINDVDGRTCPTCGAVLTALAARKVVRNRTDPVYLQQSGSRECPAGHELPDELK